MCMLNRRVQLLFDKDLWNLVVKSSKSQNISAGEFIRRAIREYIDKQKKVQGEEKPTSFKGFFKRRG